MKYINKYPTQAAYDAANKFYPNTSYIEATDEIVYAETPDYSKEYLTFDALQSGTFTLSIGSIATSYMTEISYSIDNGSTWTTTNFDNTTQTITTPTIAQGGKVLWKGTGTQMFYNWSDKSAFSSTGNFNVSGNIMSLLYGDNFVNQTTFANNSENTFVGLFEGATTLINANNLILPATTLKKWSYRQMFYQCTGLITAPQIYATTLAENCCNLMFGSCTSLTTAPATLPATTLVDRCYYSMFKNCTSLTTAPSLPATILGQQCYQEMFYECTSLNNITMLATSVGYYSFKDWVKNVAATGTFTKAASQTSLPTGDSGIPSGWTVVDAQ